LKMKSSYWLLLLVKEIRALFTKRLPIENKANQSHEIGRVGH
jgi:hypothetical protein